MIIIKCTPKILLKRGHNVNLTQVIPILFHSLFGLVIYKEKFKASNHNASTTTVLSLSKSMNVPVNDFIDKRQENYH